MFEKNFYATNENIHDVDYQEVEESTASKELFIQR